MWPKSCKNVCDVTPGISKLPLGRDFCHPRRTSGLLCPEIFFCLGVSQAQRLTPIREEQPYGGKLCNGTETAYYLLGQHLLTFFTHAQTGTGQGRLFFHISEHLKIFFFPSWLFSEVKSRGLLLELLECALPNLFTVIAKTSDSGATSSLFCSLPVDQYISLQRSDFFFL